MARHRRGALEWAVLIDEWKQTGLSLPEFCRQKGLSHGTMQGWVYKPARKQAIEAARRQGFCKSDKALQKATPAEPAPSPAFLPVRLAESAFPQCSADRAAIEIVLGGGRRVAVGPGFDEETLRRVVAALESRPC